MATTQVRSSFPFGFLPTGAANGTSTLALNAATTWLAYGFVPSETKTLSKVKAYISAVTGTLTAAGLSCDLYSDTAATGPNASLESRTSYTTDPPTAGTWIEFTGFTTSVTAGTQYWIVFKNNVGTPSSNFPTYRFGGGNSWINETSGSNIAYGWHKRATTDSGTSWATNAVVRTAGLRLEYSDGSFDGTPASQIAAHTAANSVYANRELGVLFTTPANAKLNVWGIYAQLAKTGTPTGSLRFRLYTGTTLTATTNSVVTANVVTGGVIFAYFSARQALAPSTAYRIVLSETTQADTSANCFQLYTFTIENDANSRSILPYDGTMQSTYTTDATAGPPATWAETNTSIHPIGMLLDHPSEFGAIGAGPLVAGGMVVS